mmetsp:Transcript_3829/g.5817  ORF Transcript_3829/g.5817 Transcript_3829/m.5817 type:complete len:312 (-) Transcript_3829:138-1073(-)|eukprot:CAMPEP_0197324618 /NCGR_PEP_ID=MMETSP0891-20130614/71205_1 /TAXON_ID=44058 ORGANISM="Aureoumbra lagunensis, Strain CCMP1510" /NCGR_SAMPLE_ID=MMETSP0891 /ASSEMBLY_ACC=CAM_ASM_000534 /LENGTH=311 /DNA_ID=CAMNT_0042817453 /DNA_START=1364 /DNA_END=2299 /DNA_ORIENTATION=-
MLFKYFCVVLVIRKAVVVALSSTIAQKARFDGCRRLFSDEGTKRLEESIVVIVGLGGVGSWAAEALARSSVGNLRLIDLDEVCVSNCNRQLCALDSTVGLAKAKVIAQRCQDINPHINVEPILDFVDASNVHKICFPADVVLDAIDNAADKAAILKACQAEYVPVVSVGGAGGRMDPTRIQIAQNGRLDRVAGDALFRKVRKMLDFRHVNGALIFSDEIPQKPPQDSLRRTGCDQGFGTASFLVGAFGLAAAKATVDLLLSSSRSILSEQQQKNSSLLPNISNNNFGDNEEETFIELDCPCSDFGEEEVAS